MIVELLKEPPEPAKPLTGADRRRSRRHEMTLVATLSPTDAPADPSQRIEVEIRDISLHGAGLRTTAPLPIGQTYQLDVGGGPLKLHARFRVANARLKRDGTWQIGAEFY